VRCVWKYPLNLVEGATHHYEIPDGIVRHVGEQSRTIMLWIEVDPEGPLRRRTFQVVGTGFPEIEPGFVYLGTVPIGPWVWHVYEDTRAGNVQ
jgi:hypothetical protein